MSIINDALKKAEKEKQGFQNRPAQIFSKIDGTKTGTRRWFVWAGAGVICFLGIILATSLFKQPVDSVVVPEVASPPEVVSLKEVSLPAFQLRKIDVQTPLDSSTFKLSGVLYDSQRPLAIINNRVVEEGALIKGAKLLEIKPNFVKLSFDGEEITLEIK